MNHPSPQRGRPPSFVWLLLPIALFAGAVALTALLLDRDPPPPVLRRLPEFRLVDADGRPFGSSELRGRIWIANVFFTRCHSICPRLMEDVRRLGTELADGDVDGVARVSISVDPGYDTPERLEAYAVRRSIRLGRDRILITGDDASVRRLVVRGFATDVGEPVETGPDLIDVAHTAKLILVDGAGRIRGYYDPDPAGRAALVADARRIAA